MLGFVLVKVVFSFFVYCISFCFLFVHNNKLTRPQGQGLSQIVISGFAYVITQNPQHWFVEPIRTDY